MPKGLKLSLLAISVLLIVFVFLGGLLPGGVNAGSNANAYQQIEVYSEVLQHIQNDYVVTPNITDVTNGALHGLLEGLDPDSGYLTPAEFQKYQTEKDEAKAQIGATVAKRFGYATVVSVVPDGPADKAGIAAGDVIESIGKRTTRVMPPQMISLALDGKQGTSVTCSVIEPTSATPYTITLMRTVPEYPALHVDEYENSSILYLKPYDLSKQRVQQMLTRIKKAEKPSHQKILLDLRNVSAGDFNSGIALANAFLKSGTIVTLQGQKYPQKTWTAQTKNFLTDAPLIVLVNHSTSGPAEIVAAALKENNRATLVGTRTWGSGTVQKQIQLPDGGALFLSVAKYHGPNGQAIQDTAVVPNVFVAENTGFGLLSKSNIKISNGPITTPTAPGKAAPQTPAAAPQPDDQLNKALDLLKQQKA